MSRTIRRIIVHCTATPEGRVVSVADIRRWHVQGNGWRDIGYHYVIDLDGDVHAGRPEVEVGAHAAGHNADSIGICYVGGLEAGSGRPKDTRTPAQKAALWRLVNDLQARHGGRLSVHGHNEFAAKACPCFDVRAEWQARQTRQDAPALADLSPADPVSAAPAGGFWAAVQSVFKSIFGRS